MDIFLGRAMNPALFIKLLGWKFAAARNNFDTTDEYYINQANL